MYSSFLLNYYTVVTQLSLVTFSSRETWVWNESYFYDSFFNLLPIFPVRFCSNSLATRLLQTTITKDMNFQNDSSAASFNKFYSTPKDVIDLYTKIPDYAQVKHLGNSEFINTLERLKEDFRRIRASLYEEDIAPSDSESNSRHPRRTEEVHTILNIKSELGNQFGRASRNFYKSPVTSAHKINFNRQAGIGNEGQQYLSISSCALHKTPAHYNYVPQHRTELCSNQLQLKNNVQPINFSYLNSSNKYYDSKTDSAFQDDDDDGIEANNDEKVRQQGRRHLSSATSSSASSSSTSPTTISVWSSNPELYKPREFKEYNPPANIEKRIQWRNLKNCSKSEPQLYNNLENADDPPNIIHFKAHPVPDHVHQPLFEKIMQQNKLRSDQVRQESRKRLLAQVKPFSFTANPNANYTANKFNTGKSMGHGGGQPKDFFSSNRNHELYLLQSHKNVKSKFDNSRKGVESLNNTRKLTQQHKRNLHQCLRVAQTYEKPRELFKANPAPPRTRALMAVVRLREQQEYRELKKRLRAEALMRTASLPPSMAARDKQQKESEAKITAILNKLESNSKHNINSNQFVNKAGRHRRLSTSSTDEPGNTDDDEDNKCYSEDEAVLTSSWSSKAEAKSKQPNKNTEVTKRLRAKNFTPFGPSKFSSKSDGIFESTANDNHASRLRAQAAKKRERERIKREEEEQIRLQRIENRHQRLRVWHLPAWKHASSYSSTQDISMRCELRQAASILEKESFRREMNNMLSRVQSAPLLLEGLRERKYELCKKHRAELVRNHDTTPRTKFYSPRNTTGKTANWSTGSHVGFIIDDLCGDHDSETAAIAEGTFSCNATNSDNESVKNTEFDLSFKDDNILKNRNGYYTEAVENLQIIEMQNEVEPECSNGHEIIETETNNDNENKMLNLINTEYDHPEASDLDNSRGPSPTSPLIDQVNKLKAPDFQELEKICNLISSNEEEKNYFQDSELPPNGKIQEESSLVTDETCAKDSKSKEILDAVEYQEENAQESELEAEVILETQKQHDITTDLTERTSVVPGSISVQINEANLPKRRVIEIVKEHAEERRSPAEIDDDAFFDS